MPPVEFESAIPSSEWPQTYSLDRAATGIGYIGCSLTPNLKISFAIFPKGKLSILPLIA
jgi:hypothetical protein